MDPNGTPTVPQARAQHSIRSFFQPRSPNYAPPPSATATNHSQPPILPSATITPRTSSSAEIQTQNSSLTPEATISPASEHHIQPLRRINSLLLPIPYPDAFYRAITVPSSPPNFSRMINWTDPSSNETKVVGGMVCRLDPVPSASAPTYEIYIQSLALLSPYRSRGLATAVLEDVVKAATKAGIRIESIYGHVWTQNEEALEWYAKRGFAREEQPIPGYYRKLKPDSAFVLRRRIGPSDHLQGLSQNTSTPEVTKTESAPSPVEPIRPTVTQARSFQDKGPDREWNDLPDDMGNGLLRPNGYLGTPNQGSAASSRSSSRSGAGGKKKRVYPAAAFGS